MIYLDHNATSPLLPEVLEAMRPWLGVPANPASPHRLGQAAAAAVEGAREGVAALLGGRPEGVIFTSGATEANHLFLRGAATLSNRRWWWASPIEHPCVHDALARATDLTVEHLPIRPDGRCEIPTLPSDLAGLSLMAANHETGVLQPLLQARAATRAVGALLHIDATQAAGRVPLDLSDADGVVLSGHKLGGPAGTGALLLPDGEPFPPLFGGGGQERGRRAGTVNTAGVVGLGEACRLALAELEERARVWASLREELESGLRALGGRIIGDQVERVPNTTCVVFEGLRAESLVQGLDLLGICASAGAACSSGSLEPSPVLTAMGEPEPEGGLRLSLGPRSEHADIGAVLRALPEVLNAARAAAMWED